MRRRWLFLLAALAFAAPFACAPEPLVVGGATPDAGDASPDSTTPDAGDASPDSTTPPTPDAPPEFALPPECSNPGPFAEPTSIGSQILGTWINCDKSIFTGADVPIDEVGVVVRADLTWQKLTYSAGQLVPLTHHTDYGTWAMQAPSRYPGVLFTWDVTTLVVDPIFSPDGRSMHVSTPTPGDGAILAKAIGTP